MAGRIPQTFIDDLIDRTDIVEVVNSRVSLKKSGKNYSACCPFHHEKTPSFTVSPQKQFYYCFGCGAAGNAIGFIMAFDNQDFPTVIEGLAKDAGMEIPQESKVSDPQQKLRKSIYSQLESADKFYRSQLKSSPIAIDYLKSRGLSGTTARDYGVGFAPDSWDSLAGKAANDTTATNLLEQGGMLIKREQKQSRGHDQKNGYYDRFRNRVMFPIRDQRGRTIAFGGRVLGDEKPKYLNSPETPVFHKSRELYGLYEMLQQRSRPSSAIVVEGYMDVVSLAQYDIRNAVATLGTSVAQSHLDKLFRYVSEVVFCFDGDSAGRKAAERALEACLPTMLDGRSASFLFLPEGEDPDTVVREFGKEKFSELTANATSLSDFMFQQASQGLRLDSDDQRAVLAHRLLPKIAILPKGLLQKIILQRLAETTGLSTDQLLSIDVPKETRRTQPAESQTESDPRGNHRGTEEIADHTQSSQEAEQTESALRIPPSPFLQRLLSIVLQMPALAKHVALDDSALKEEPGAELFQQIRAVLTEYPDAEFSTLLGYWMGYDPDTASQLSAIYAGTLLSDTPHDKLTQEFEEIIARWASASKKDRIKAKLSRLQSIPYQELTTEQREETKKLFESLKEP